MNWNRVMNVFIVIFLVVNGFLALYQYVYESDKYTLSDERYLQMQRVYAQKGIQIRDYIPSYYPKQELVLGTHNYDRELIKENILGSDYTIDIDQTTLGESLSNGDETLIFYLGDQDGYIFYRGDNSHYIPDNLSHNGVDATALDFAKDLFGDDVVMKVTYRTVINDDDGNAIGYRLELNEVFGGEDVIFQTSIKLLITEEGIKEALAIRYEPIEFSGALIEVYPFDEAAYSLMFYLEDELDEDGTAILNIESGYYNIDIDDKKLTNRLEPYYRLITADGNVYYVNAYTNIVSEP